MYVPCTAPLSNKLFTCVEGGVVRLGAGQGPHVRSVRVLVRDRGVREVGGCCAVGRKLIAVIAEERRVEGVPGQKAGKRAGEERNQKKRRMGFDRLYKIVVDGSGFGRGKAQTGGKF